MSVGAKPAFVLLLPGTSIRPGPGAEKAAKYRFEPEVRSIYRTTAKTLAEDYALPVLQICWRRFPADGGTTQDAVHDMLAGIRFMRSKYGWHCGVLIVGYSFGGAALWALLQTYADRPALVNAAIGEDESSRQPWLYGCIALSGARKGTGEDKVNMFAALQQLERIRAPLLIIHGTDDDNVAISAAHKTFREAPAMKSLCVLEGADHNLRVLHWQSTISRVCIQWLVHAAAPRGVSNASRARVVLQAQHAAAIELCEISMQDPTVTLAFDPLPQYLGCGGLVPYHAYDVPVADTTSVLPRRSLPCYEQPPETLQALCSLHAERQRKAREMHELERRGPTAAAYAKWRASVEARGSRSERPTAAVRRTELALHVQQMPLSHHPQA